MRQSTDYTQYEEASATPEVELHVPEACIEGLKCFTEVLPDCRVLYLADCTLRSYARALPCSAAAWTEVQARAKLISEVAERYVAIFCRPGHNRRDRTSHSTGFAAHVDRAEAHSQAEFELLERTFLSDLRSLPSIAPTIVKNGSWSYRLPRDDGWCTVAKAIAGNVIGWGSAARADVQASVAAAEIEAWMMALSKKHFGCSGAGVATHPSRNGQGGGNIMFADWPHVICMGEVRHVSQASWTEA